MKAEFIRLFRHRLVGGGLLILIIFCFASTFFGSRTSSKHLMSTAELIGNTEKQLHELEIKQKLSLYKLPEKQKELQRQYSVLSARLQNVEADKQIISRIDIRVIDGSLILFTLTICYFLFAYDRMYHTQLLNRVTKTGLRRQMGHRLLVSVLVLLSVTFLLHVIVILQFLFCGVSVWSVLPQLEGYDSSVLSVSLLTYFLFYSVVWRFLSLMVLCLTLGIVLYLFQLSKRTFLILIAIFSTGFWMTHFIPLNTALYQLRWSNLLGWLEFEQSFQDLFFVKIMYCWFAHEWMLIMMSISTMALSGVLLSISWVGDSQAEEMNEIRTYLKGDSLFHSVRRRYWWRSGSIVILLILLLYAGWSALSYEVNITPNEVSFQKYLSEWGGVLNEEKEIAILQENRRFEELIVRYEEAENRRDLEEILRLREELMPYEGFKLFFEKYGSIKEAGATELVDSRPFEYLFSTKHSFNFWFRMIISLLAGRFILGLGWQPFIEKENHALASTTVNGGRILFHLLFMQTLATACFVAFLSFGSLLIAIQRSWVLRWDVSMRSALGWMISGPVYFYYLLWLLLVVLSTLVILQLASLLLYRFNRLTTIAVALLTFILCFNLELTKWWFLNPFAMLWPGDQPASIHFIINLMTLMVLSIILYRKMKARFLNL